MGHQMCWFSAMVTSAGQEHGGDPACKSPLSHETGGVVRVRGLADLTGVLKINW